MIVRVGGCKDQNVADELKRAALFFGRELLSRQMFSHIEVEINLTTTIRDLGDCCITHYNDWNKARYFEIRLRKPRSLPLMIKTLAHEMVHLKQFAKGELNDDHTKWKGFYIDSESIDYFDQPWEIEAASLEAVLYIMYEEFNTSINNGKETPNNHKI